MRLIEKHLQSNGIGRGVIMAPIEREEMRNDNIGFPQGDYPTVYGDFSRYDKSPFDVVREALISNLYENYPSISSFLFGKPNDNPYLLMGDGPTAGKRGRPKIIRGAQAMGKNPASFRGSKTTTGDEFMLKEHGFTRSGNTRKFENSKNKPILPQPETHSVLYVDGMTPEELTQEVFRVFKIQPKGTPAPVKQRIKLGGRGRPSLAAKNLIYEDFINKPISVPVKGSLKGNALRAFLNQVKRWLEYVSWREEKLRAQIKAGDQEAALLLGLHRKRAESVKKRLRLNGYIE